MSFGICLSHASSCCQLARTHFGMAMLTRGIESINKSMFFQGRQRRWILWKNNWIGLITSSLAASPNEPPHRLILRRRSKWAENNEMDFTCEKRLAYKAARCSWRRIIHKSRCFHVSISDRGSLILHANNVGSSQVGELFCLGLTAWSCRTFKTSISRVMPERTFDVLKKQELLWQLALDGSSCITDM